PGNPQCAGDIALSFVGNRNDGLQLQWVTDGDDAFGSPNRSGSVVWGRLPGLVVEKPPQRLSPVSTGRQTARGDRLGTECDCTESPTARSIMDLQLVHAAYCGEACPASTMKSHPSDSLPRSRNIRPAEANVVDTKGTARKKSCQAARTFSDSSFAG